MMRKANTVDDIRRRVQAGEHEWDTTDIQVLLDQLLPRVEADARLVRAKDEIADDARHVRLADR